jgi:hypothetical protein
MHKAHVAHRLRFLQVSKCLVGFTAATTTTALGDPSWVDLSQLFTGALFFIVGIVWLGLRHVFDVGELRKRLDVVEVKLDKNATSMQDKLDKNATSMQDKLDKNATSMQDKMDKIAASMQDKMDKVLDMMTVQRVERLENEVTAMRMILSRREGMD